MITGRIFTALYWAWILSELLLQIVMRTRAGKGEVKDRGSLLLLLPVLYGSVWGAFWWGETHAHTMFSGASWLRTVALAMMAAGLAIRWTAIVSLGRSFSTNVAIRTGQTMYKSGLYRWVRHPSYSGMLLSFASIGVWERNWISLAFVTVLPMAALLYRMHVEEAALTDAFGESYRAYCSETRRIVPGIY
jgi:protein-S-isoprenylcysteine O-methyltransferase Ste14